MATRRRGCGLAGGVALALLMAAPVAEARPVAVVGGTVHPISGPAIENGVLLVDGGTVRAVGPAAAVAIPDDAERIDATGRHVWPSLINLLTYTGIFEVAYNRATNDTRSHGTMNPGSRVEVALNASSPTIDVTRANGVLLAATLPRGGLVSGTAAAIALDGWTAEEMVRRAPVGLVIHWPAMKPPDAKADSVHTWEKEVARLDEMVEQARVYAAARADGTEPRDADVRWESLRGFVSGQVPAWIHAGTVPQIRAALDWTERHGVPMVLVDGTASRSGHSRLVAAELAARDVPVVLRMNRRPRHRHEPYDAPFTLAADLHAAGVRVVFGTWNRSNARHLPAEAARAVAYGLPRSVAEHALTLGAAEVLGIHDRYGSLEPGKSATFLIVNGDVLETRMHVERAWLDGRELSLESHHTRLWKKWSARPLPDE